MRVTVWIRIGTNVFGEGIAQRNRSEADRVETREWIPLGHYSW